MGALFGTGREPDRMEGQSQAGAGLALLTAKSGKKRKSRLRWRNVIPLHVLILALALSIAQPLKHCAEEVGSILKKSSEEAEHFMMEHPLEFGSADTFRASRANWHKEFDGLLRDVSRGYKTIILEEDYDGYCTAKYPIVIFVVDCIALLMLILTAGYFLFQDATTSFGASGQEIFLALNGLLALFTILGVFTFPALHLLRLAVKLSTKLEDCTKELKQAQRSVVASGLDLDVYNLHANVWDGMVFGVREPVFNYIVDKSFEEWIFRRLHALLLMGMVIATFLVYRTNVKSLVRWRVAIPSVVCIGVTFPSSSDPHKLWRVGSGCIVSSSRGLILTNWHLFQRMGVDTSYLSRDTSDHSKPELHRLDSDVWSVDSGSGRRNHSDSPLFGAMTSPWRPTNSDEEGFMLKDSVVTNMVRESQFESMKKSLQNLRMENEDMDPFGDEDETALDDERDEFGIPLHRKSAPAIIMSKDPHVHQTSAATNPSTTSAPESAARANSSEPQSKLHRHLTNQARYAEALGDIFPDMKIYVGTVSRGHPKWEYEASFTGVESPSTEFTPFGLDLLLLKITGKANFEGLQTEEGHSTEHYAFTYRFESVTTEPIAEVASESLTKFNIGNPFKLYAGTDKLRLLGYPASGGFTLSVLTGYFTSISFDYPTKHRGAWLNVNIALPHGGSGGAAINSKGELVGICTQTKGDLTNIRSITEAKHLIEKAKKEVDQERKKKKQQAASAREAAAVSALGSSATGSATCNVRKVLSATQW